MCSNANLLTRTKSHLRLLSITGLFLFSFLNLFAKNYYFSSTTGNDAYSNLQAQNAATPWKSITKLNAVFSTLVGGDSILFKRGETFYGTIVVNSSGLATSSIVITAYGTGANPIISGFTSISSWTADAGGIYKATGNIPSGNTASLSMVTINNQPQQIGRYPNASAANGGYLKYQSFNDTAGLKSITDTLLTGTTNWTGAEVVIRKRLWVLDRCKVTRHSGNTVFYTNPEGSDYTCTNNYGYFFQNDVRTLDQFGEWYFDNAAGVLKMYFGTAVPSSYSIKAATVDALVTIRAKKYISFSNLNFEGANMYGVYAGMCGYISIKNCGFTNIGAKAIYMETTSGITVENTSTYNILSNAMQFACSGDSNITIRNCTVKRTGAIRGMGQSNGNSYKGISVDLAKNLLIENNKVDTTGYVAIEFDGSNVLVKNNVVNYFCYNKDDAGGIYSWIPLDAPANIYYVNRVIRNNIVMNGVGAPDGRPSSTLFASGIYLDGTIMNVDVLDNTVFNMGKNGIHCNNPNNIKIAGNTSFNNLNAVSFMRWPGATIRNLSIKNNIFYPKTSGQQNLFYTNAALYEPDTTTLPAVLHTLGTIDSNYHSSVNPTGFSYEVYSTTGGPLIPVSSQSIEGWRNYSGADIHSKIPFREAPSYYLRNTVGSNMVANGTFDLNINGVTAFGSGVVSSWDNTGKISGGALKIQMNNPVANRYILVYSPVGTVSATKKYVLKFKTLGTTAFGIVRAYLRKTALPYTSLTPIQLKVFDTTARQHEFLFTAPVAESNASFVIEIEQNSGITYVDDIEFYEANADVYNVDDYLRFEYNATNAPVSVNLGANYIGVDATYYPGTITLQPFSSKILVKDTSVVRQALAAQATALPVACYGQKTDITVTASGGIPPYTGTGRFNVSAGTYTYTVKDLRGVTASTTFTAVQPAAPLDVTATAGTITVYGGKTTVNLVATGGTAPYTGTLNFTNVAAGTYTYYIRDARGCSDSVTVTITQPQVLRAFATDVHVKCYGGTGTITVTASGGIPPYVGTGVYAMDAGTYTFKVRDAAGAVAYAFTSLTQPALPLQARAVAGTISVFGGATSVTVAATGGTAPYTGAGVKSNIVAGTYSYTITDANGCTAAAPVIVTQPPQELTATNSTAAIKCFDGTANITVAAAGGTLPYTGTGSNMVNAGKGSVKLSFPQAVNDNYAMLYFPVGPVSPAKNYVLYFSTVGTTATGTLRAALRQTYSPWGTFVPKQPASFGTARIDHAFIFTAPPEETANFLIEVDQNAGTVYIDNIAFFELNASNKPTGPNLYAYGDFETGTSNIYTYSANNNHTVAWDTTRKISRTYYFNIKDAVNTSVNAIVKTSQPVAPLSIDASAGTITGAGGTTSVMVTATGGTAPYTGTGTFTNVGAGTRTYTVTDANGCTASKTITLTVTASRPVAGAAGKQELKVLVYPNPSSSSFELQLKDGGDVTTSIMVTTAEGKLMYAAANKQRYFTFGENFASGIYFVKVQQANKQETIKIVKAK